MGAGIAELLDPSMSYAARLSLSVTAVLIFSTVVQMVFGELAPKNLAIARTVPLARALSRSTLVYLTIAGPLGGLVTLGCELLEGVAVDGDVGELLGDEVAGRRRQGEDQGDPEGDAHAITTRESEWGWGAGQPRGRPARDYGPPGTRRASRGVSAIA